MPLDPYLAAKIDLLDGATDWAQALSNPQALNRLMEFFADPDGWGMPEPTRCTSTSAREPRHLTSASPHPGAPAARPRPADFGMPPHRRCPAHHALRLVSELSYASARDAILLERYGEHPQLPELRPILERIPDRELPIMRRLLAQPDENAGEQFEFDLDIVIAGLERRLG